MMTKFYDILFTLLTPLIYLVGLIDLPHRKITGAHYFKYRDSINVGDIILTKSNWAPINLVNPGPFKHAAVYVGNIYGDEIKYVFESTRHGVILTNLVDFLLSKDAIAICELKIKGEINKETLQNTVLKLKGLPYDYLFDTTGKAVYCYELGAITLTNLFPSLKLLPREIVKGKKIFDAQTFLDEQLFNIKIDSRKDVF